MTALYPWLLAPYQQITQAFQQGLGHHALLLKAESGLGVEALIEPLAARFMCQTPVQNQACGVCHHCQLMQAHSHPDFHRLAPIEDKDIGVDQVREINEIVNQHAQQNGNKTVYINGAERLTEAAANALLKTLEEPRPNTYFLFRADSSASLLATIYSRCQVWHLNLPPLEQAINWLQEQEYPHQGEADSQHISTALAMNYGRPLAALETLQQGLIEKRRDFLRQFWLFYRRRSPLELLPFFDKERLIQQIDWLLSFLNDALKHRLDIQQHWQNPDLAAGIRQFSQQQTAQDLLTANQIMQKVRSDLKNINGVNAELILLDGLTKLITDVFKD